MTTRKSITFTLITLPFVAFLIVLMIHNGLKVGFWLWLVASVGSFILVLLGLVIVYFLPEKWKYTLPKSIKEKLKSDEQKPRQSVSKKRAR